jgi:hypothetical protein
LAIKNRRFPLLAESENKKFCPDLSDETTIKEKGRRVKFGDCDTLFLCKKMNKINSTIQSYIE